MVPTQNNLLAGRTVHSTAIQYDCMKSQRVRLDDISSYYGLSPDMFSRLSALRAYISGAVALMVARDQPAWGNTRLDIYIQAGERSSSYRTLVTYLGTYGYISVKPGHGLHQYGYAPHLIASNFNNVSTGRCVQIIRVTSTVPEFVSTWFYSRHLMNWIVDGLCTVLYPLDLHNNLIHLTGNYTCGAVDIVKTCIGQGFVLGNIEAVSTIIQSLRCRCISNCTHVVPLDTLFRYLQPLGTTRFLSTATALFRYLLGHHINHYLLVDNRVVLEGYVLC